MNNIVDINGGKPVAEKENPLNDCCGSCIHFLAAPDKNVPVGICKANPPQVITVPVQSQMRGMSIEIQSHFPSVNWGAHCGIFEPFDAVDETDA
jgi:hypothetical protein